MAYINNRQKYGRPQGMLWSDNYTAPATAEDPLVPPGFEYGSTASAIDQSFLILSDHNRSDIDVATERIQTRKRMINGRMRSFHVADKIKISTSWEMLPSRRFAGDPQFNTTTGISPLSGSTTQYTVDGGAGASDLLDWYNSHTGSFFVYLSYDNPQNFDNDYDRLSEYSEVIEMYISDFSYNIVSRGATNHDFWNVSVTLEEV
jgi:hypothetical protein